MQDEPRESATSTRTQTDSPASQSTPDAAAGRLVPVTESIRYRRRAQQAETRLQELEQKLNDMEAQLSRRTEELGLAEAQRDETAQQLTATENRSAAERLLSRAGVVDMETACLLLSKRVDLSADLDGEALSQNVEKLLLDKPFLRRRGSLPPASAASRPAVALPAARLAQAAEQAVRSGDRRDVAEYLRLRRQSELRPATAPVSHRGTLVRAGVNSATKTR